MAELNLPSMTSVCSWRRAVGESARLWSQKGTLRVDEGRWLALSGAPSPDYNVALCYDRDGAATVEAVRGELLDAGAPAVLLLAGSALGAAQALADAGWVCIGATSLMCLGVDTAPEPRLAPPGVEQSAAPAVRRLGPEDLDEARRVIAAAFGLSTSDAAAAVPECAMTGDDGISLWGLDAEGQLGSVIVAVEEGARVVFWHLGTSPGLQRRGLGRRLMSQVQARLVVEGAEEFLLLSVDRNQAVYERLGYRVVEYWQQWSRPRWVLGVI